MNEKQIKKIIKRYKGYLNKTIERELRVLLRRVFGEFEVSKEDVNKAKEILFENE